MNKVFEEHEETAASMLVLNVKQPEDWFVKTRSFIVMPDAAAGISQKGIMDMKQANTFYVNGWKEYHKPKKTHDWKKLNHTRPHYEAKERLEFRFVQDKVVGKISDSDHTFKSIF